MDPYYVLTSYLHNLRINSQTVKAKIDIVVLDCPYCVYRALITFLASAKLKRAQSL
jgi:hypothetical protein